MELFREDGHLTGEGLQALIDGTLDEMGRLEAAEHLSFCDKCLVDYTALLTDDVLLTPETPQKPQVMKRLRSRAWKVRVGRYATVAAAACLAVVMWAAGSFAAPRAGRDDQTAQAQADQAAANVAAGAMADGGAAPAAQEDIGFFGHIDNFLDSTVAGLNGFLDRLNPGPSDSAEQEKRREAEKKEAERKQKEQVFDQRATGQPNTPDDNSGTGNG